MVQVQKLYFSLKYNIVLTQFHEYQAGESIYSSSLQQTCSFVSSLLFSKHYSFWTQIYQLSTLDNSCQSP